MQLFVFVLLFQDRILLAANLRGLFGIAEGIPLSSQGLRVAGSVKRPAHRALENGTLETPDPLGLFVLLNLDDAKPFQVQVVTLHQGELTANLREARSLEDSLANS